MLLTTAAARIYLTTSQLSLACGVLPWDQYLLRLKFIKDCAKVGSLEVGIAAALLREHSLEDDDKWVDDGPNDLETGRGPIKGPAESVVSVLNRQPLDEPPILALIPAGITGLSLWTFRQSDPDFFPSIPHGHWRRNKRRKLDAYRGWIYERDRQTGREPRWKIIALWNDSKFRSFAYASIQYYLVAFPRYNWLVKFPLNYPADGRIISRPSP